MKTAVKQGFLAHCTVVEVTCFTPNARLKGSIFWVSQIDLCHACEQPDATMSSEMQPEAADSSQMQPGAARSSQKQPYAARSSQMHPCDDECVIMPAAPQLQLSCVLVRACYAQHRPTCCCRCHRSVPLKKHDKNSQENVFFEQGSSDSGVVEINHPSRKTGLHKLPPAPPDFNVEETSLEWLGGGNKPPFLHNGWGKPCPTLKLGERGGAHTCIPQPFGRCFILTTPVPRHTPLWSAYANSMNPRTTHTLIG